MKRKTEENCREDGKTVRKREETLPHPYRLPILPAKKMSLLQKEKRKENLPHPHRLTVLRAKKRHLNEKKNGGELPGRR